jgi:hypothetical protein
VNDVAEIFRCTSGSIQTEDPAEALREDEGRDAGGTASS